jgi:hypothetical protein
MRLAALVSTPSLAFRSVVGAHEPVVVQASHRLAVEGLDERVARRLTRPAEVERDDAGVRPQVQLARNEFSLP